MKRLFIIFFIFLSVGTAFAQDPMGNPVGGDPISAASPPGAVCTKPSAMMSFMDPAKGNWISSVVKTVLPINVDGRSNPYIASAKGIAAKSMTMALQMGGVLLVLTLLFTAIFSNLEGQSIQGELMGVFIKAAIVSGVLANYETIVGLGFEQLMKGLTSISGADSPSKILGDYLMNMLAALAAPIVTVFETIGCKGIFSTSVSLIVEMLITVGLMGIAVFMLLKALIQAAFGLLAGPLVLAVAIAFGPIFIICSLNDITKPYFQKWLGFALNGAIMTAVAGVVLRLFSEAAVISLTNSSTGTSGLLTGTLATLVTLSIAERIFSQIPDYAAKLVGDSGAKGKSPSSGGGGGGGGGGNKGGGGASAVPAAVKIASNVVPVAAVAGAVARL